MPFDKPQLQDGADGRVTAVAFTIRDFCATFGISRTSTYAEIRAGRLRAVRVGKRRTLILKVDAENWAASLRPIHA